MPGKLADATMNVFSTKDHETQPRSSEHDTHSESQSTEQKKGLVSKAFKTIGKLNPFSK